MQDITFVDTETTSLSAENGKIWEFGGLRLVFDPENSEWLKDNPHVNYANMEFNTPFGKARVYSTHFQIEQSLSEADPMSLKIGNYWSRFGSSGEWATSGPQYPARGEVVEPSYAAELIRRFTHNSHIAGNVISFDSERLERLLRYEGTVPTWHYHLVDTETLALGMLAANGVHLTYPFSSQAVAEAIGVEPPQGDRLHNAFWDAEWCLRMWLKIYSPEGTENV